MEHQLNAKQELFCQRVVDGDTQTEAYMAVYPASRKWKVETLAPAASRLAAKESIRNRIAELTRQSLRRACVRKADVLAELWNIAKAPDSTPREKLAALKTLLDAAHFVEAQLWREVQAETEAEADGTGGSGIICNLDLSPKPWELGQRTENSEKGQAP